MQRCEDDGDEELRVGAYRSQARQLREGVSAVLRHVTSDDQGHVWVKTERKTQSQIGVLVVDKHRRNEDRANEAGADGRLWRVLSQGLSCGTDIHGLLCTPSSQNTDPYPFFEAVPHCMFEKDK